MATIVGVRSLVATIDAARPSRSDSNVAVCPRVTGSSGDNISVKLVESGRRYPHVAIAEKLRAIGLSRSRSESAITADG